MRAANHQIAIVFQGAMLRCLVCGDSMISPMRSQRAAWLGVHPRQCAVRVAA